MGPADTYTYNNLREFHRRTKRRWRQADILGADEVKVIENNRRHFIKYKRPLSIFGWFTTNSKYEKKETFYQSVVGDPYYDYNKKFVGYILDWWGVGGKFTKKRKKDRNVTSVPNSPMFNPSVHFDKNSFMEKLYVDGKTYDEAVGSTFKGKAQLSDIIRSLSDYNKEIEKMDDDTAYEEALRVAEIVSRNMALDKNSPVSNEYNFMTNYYNKFIDPTIRTMMKVDINLHFLKEAMKNNPNLSFYVMGPYDRMMRIQGMVSQRCENIIVSMETSANSTKYDYEYTYSFGSHTKVNHSEKGFIEAKQLPVKTTKIKNLMYGNRPCRVDRRYDNELMYDMILEGPDNVNLWIDAFHNTFISPDYSEPKNLIGKDIIC